jgi:hypothetical protein
MVQLLTAARRLRPERRHLLSDSIAGLTFAVVNVPQAMAHASGSLPGDLRGDKLFKRSHCTGWIMARSII